MRKTSKRIPRKSLAFYLRKSREGQGLKQKDVSEHLGFKSSQFISNWERGISVPPIDKLGALVHLLKLDPKMIEEFYQQRSQQMLSLAIRKALRN